MTTLIVCPGCKSPMHLVRHDAGAELDVCRSCGGTWLDWPEVRLVAPRPDDAPEVLDELLLSPARGGPAVRRCPRCARRLRTQQSQAIPSLRIDGCDAHGLYLDADELEAIQALAIVGGPKTPKPQRRPEPRPSALDADPSAHRTPEVEDMLARTNERARRPGPYDGWSDLFTTLRDLF